jgi:hypothetical protein
MHRSEEGITEMSEISLEEAGSTGTARSSSTNRVDAVCDRLRRDVAALVEFDRRTATPGERHSAHHIANRLREIGADDVALSSFRTQSSWAPAHFAHAVNGILAAMLPGPLGRAAAAAAAVSCELDVSGRSQWVRRLIPGRRGMSVSARIRAVETPRRTVILVAHHDAAHNGLLWHPSAVAASRFWSRHTGHAIPSHAPILAALAAAAAPSKLARGVAAGVLTAIAALIVQSMCSPTTPGANDNASGVAAVLEVARRLASSPFGDTDVLLVFPGGEEVGNTGIRAWLRANRATLEPHTTLVINLDSVGSNGHLVVARRESLTGWLDERDVERALTAAAEIGIPLQLAGIPNATDAVATKQAGLPTISLLSLEDGWISHLHRTSDTLDHVNWNTIVDAVALTEHLAKRWNERSMP